MRLTLGITLLLACFCWAGQAEDISGPLSGSLGPGTFNVVEDISVEMGDTLTIQPGTTLLMIGARTFSIFGYLVASGTEDDSIYFGPQNVAFRWHGIIFFSYANDNSRMEYCYITGSDCQALEINATNPTISHSTFENNIAGTG